MHVLRTPPSQQSARHPPTGLAACSLFPTARTSSMSAAASAWRCMVSSWRMSSAVRLAQGMLPWICLRRELFRVRAGWSVGYSAGEEAWSGGAFGEGGSWRAREGAPARREGIRPLLAWEWMHAAVWECGAKG